jgi:hypothetical protein
MTSVARALAAVLERVVQVDVALLTREHAGHAGLPLLTHAEHVLLSVGHAVYAAGAAVRVRGEQPGLVLERLVRLEDLKHGMDLVVTCLTCYT